MEERTISIEAWYKLAKERAKEGEKIPLCFMVNGISMTPLIRTGMDAVTILPKEGPVKKGDIVLFRAKTRTSDYVLHRVYRVNGDLALTLGDGNLAADGWVRTEDILGVAAALERNGRWIDLESLPLRLWGRLWMRLLPVRRSLLTLGGRQWEGKEKR